MMTLLASPRIRRRVMIFACLALLLVPVLVSKTAGASPLPSPTIASLVTTGGGGGGHKCSKPNFFGLEPWYAYLDYGYDSVTKSCQIKNFKFLGSNSDIPLILLAIVNDLLRIAGLVAVAFVIMGGVKYMTSQGNPDAMSAGQKTIIDALIGLLIALLAVAFVTFLGKTLT